MIEFSTTDGLSETIPLMDEVSFQNSAAYLKRSYYRMEVMIEKPKDLSYSEEVHCRLEILQE